jgi:TolA-binding protein
LAEAIDAFSRIPELYPSAERVPWAVYRVGLLQADMGDTGDAIASFERVVNTFPESDVADLAQEKLRELR